MRVSQRSGLFSGVAALACATVLLEIALSRIHGALFGQPHAFVTLALSLVGAGLGGALLYAAPSLVRPPALFARLAALSSLASGATLAAIILIAQRGPGSAPAPGSLPWLALVYAASTAPFALAGLALAAAIRHVAAEMPRLYLLDLVGGSLGALAAAAALRAGAPRAALAAAIFFAVAGVFFFLGSRREGEQRAPGGLVATFVLGSVVLLAGDVGAPWLRLAGLRRAAPDRTEIEAWSERSLITVDRPRAGTAAMRIDGVPVSPILDAKMTPPQQPEDIAYALHRDQGPVLVVGAGGGRDVRAALKAGQKDVVAVEGDRGVVELMRGKYAEFSGRLYDRPEVRLVLGDGRSFARRAPQLFRNIVVPSAGTAEAAATGALALSESRLATVEGMGDLLARLLPEGTLVVSRPEGDLERLLALTAAALRRAGAAEPNDHLFACSAAQRTALLVRRAPLARADIDALRRHCRKHKLAEAFAPDRPQTPTRARIVAAADARAAAPGATTDLTPPTDDRPFFSYAVPARRLPAVLGDWKALRAEHAGLFALSALLAVASVLFAIAGLLPRLAARAGRALRTGGAAAGAAPAPLGAVDGAASAPLGAAAGAAAAAAPAPLGAARAPRQGRALAFFAAIGAGFALLDLAVFRHALLMLDLPSHELPAALVILLVSAGLGGLLTARVAPGAAAGASARAAEALAAAAALAAVGLVPLARWSLGLGSFPRALLAVALLAAFGLLAGSLAPLGVKLVAALSPALLPLCWALGALAGAAAMALGALCAMNLGYSAVLLGAGLAYLIAAATVPPAAAGAATVHDPRDGARDDDAAAGAPPVGEAAGARPDMPEAAPIA
ncbi:hypothetical protein [Sorangium sp. So ce1335]|uniref:hypothetical protein n=1 Tax=Sorangium sp. So ce1335 TaxID=3133335 RepID=UPI003F6457D0